MIYHNAFCIVSLRSIETLMRGIFDTMHHNGPKYYNRYTIQRDGPTGKVSGIQKRISATLTVLTFPNSTRSMEILSVSGDSSSRFKLEYRAWRGKTQRVKLCCVLQSLSSLVWRTARGLGPNVSKCDTSSHTDFSYGPLIIRRTVRYWRIQRRKQSW